MANYFDKYTVGVLFLVLGCVWMSMPVSVSGDQKVDPRLPEPYPSLFDDVALGILKYSSDAIEKGGDWISEQLGGNVMQRSADVFDRGTQWISNQFQGVKSWFGG